MGLDNYRNGTKHNWRGWQWNRIVERLSVPVEEALVLYLAGPEDLDREKALAKGFRSENLIAVDLEEENIRRVREAGGIGICADLNNLLEVWPADWPIDAVVADYCAGVTAHACRLAYSANPLDGSTSMAVGIARPTVIAVNLQRGRDPLTNDERRLWEDWLDWGIMAGDQWDNFDHLPAKHRGRFFVFLYAVDVYNELKRLGELTGEEVDLDVVEVVSGVPNLCLPAFNSYYSNRVYMDSVVMRAWIKGAAPEDPEELRERQRGYVYHNAATGKPVPREKVQGVTRKIAAARAVRTQRLRRTA